VIKSARPGQLNERFLGTRERHLESLLEATLKQLIILKNFPRGMIQVVLQVETTPENDYVNNKIMRAAVVSLITVLFLLVKCKGNNC
jgi:hypothetical protein